MGPFREDIPSSQRALAKFAELLLATIDEQDVRILGWASESVTRREIADWIGESYESTQKRIWRLCSRLRKIAPECAMTLAPEERRELERYFRRLQVRLISLKDASTPPPSIEDQRIDP